MAYPAAEFRAVANNRIKSLLWPREHGAWGILLVPLVTGAFAAKGAGEWAGTVLLLAVAALALFCLRTPVESLLGTTPMRAQTSRERRAAAAVIAILTLAAVSVLAVLLWLGHWDLLPIGTFAAAAFVAQTGVKKLGRAGRMPAQIIGALGLTSTAAAASAIVAGRLDGNGIILWLVNWLFAANQIYFVQLRIHSTRVSGWAERFAQGWTFFVMQAGMVVVLGLTQWRGWLPGVALVAFVPVLVRGFAWFFAKPQPLLVHRLGKTELAHAITFGVLLIIGYRLG